MPRRVPHIVNCVKINPTCGSPASSLPGRGRGGRGVQDPARQWSHQSSKTLVRAAGTGPPPGSSRHQPAWQPLSPDLQKEEKVNKSESSQLVRISRSLTSRAVFHITESIYGIKEIYNDFMLRQCQQLSS